jgi:Holliday junction resolvasome RuvABC endonuclease subunit
MSRAAVIGLDLSLTATGVCWVQPGDSEPDLFTIKTSPKDCVGKRLNVVLEKLIDLDVDNSDGPITHAVVEDLPFNARAAGQTGMVHGVVRHFLWNHFVSVVTVPPATLKVWATGKGNATKPDMRMEAFKRLDVEERDDNRVDALWLWTLGAHLLGDPVLSLPQSHTRALDKLDTSTIGTAA